MRQKPAKPWQYEYSWEHSDRPGLWYALMKTHMDFYPNDVLPSTIIQCNSTTGCIDDLSTGPWMDFWKYFNENDLCKGNYGKKLHRVPDKQPIIFSRCWNESRSGLGVDHNYMYNKETG